MGRADLSRHRKSSPSNTPPIRFPATATWVLSELSAHAYAPIVRALTSINCASTQRTQVQAVKLLGIALRDAHTTDGQKHPPALKCSCLSDATTNPVCRLATPVLIAILFNSPGATAGLVSTALRAVLAARCAGVPGFDDSVHAFTVRIVAWSALMPKENADLVQGAAWFLQAAADVSALAVVIAESQSRHWVLDNSQCVLGALNMICSISDLYRRTAVEDGAVSFRCEELTNCLVKSGHKISPPVNRSILEAACDASMKAAQDLINHLLNVRPHSPGNFARPQKEAIDRVVRSFRKVLELPTAPRKCAMACSVSYVSGVLFASTGGRTADKVAAILRGHILSCLDRFPPFSRLSLLRAVMEAPAAKLAVPLLLFPVRADGDDTRNDAGLYLFDILASITTSSADVHMRFLAMDALIACLHRKAPEQLDKHSRNVVLTLVYKRLQEPFPGVSSQIRDAMDALVAVGGDDKEATKFWTKMATSLLHGGWHIKGIYAPLSVLVKRVGALRVLEVEPECQSLAMLATGADSRLAKPVSDWLGVFWKILRTECFADPLLFNNITNEPLVCSLVHEGNASLRERTAEHILPAFLRASGLEAVEASAMSLLQCLEKNKTVTRTSRMRGAICIMSVARHSGVFIGSFADPNVPNLLCEALQSGPEDMRSSALDLVVTSRACTEPVSQEELDLVYGFLPIALMPGGSPSQRSRFRHSMRRLLERIAACRHAARDGSSGWWMRERKERYGGLRTNAFEDKRISLLERVKRFSKMCSSLLLSSVYPGAAFSRRTTALEVTLLLSKTLGFDDHFHSPGVSPVASICGLTACLLDEWERPRRAALEVITGLNNPVPGFDSREKVDDLYKFALPLLDSPRQKDVDSGASLCRCIFRKYVLPNTGYCFPKAPATAAVIQHDARALSEDEGISPGNGASTSSLAYAVSLLDSLENCAELAETDFTTSCRLGLFHGRCLLLRYLLQDLPWKQLTSSADLKVARMFVRRFLALCERCVHIAIDGVSFEFFDQHENIGHGSCGGEEDGEDNILLQEEKQIISTSCFLSLKEICISVGVLIHDMPITVSVGARHEDEGIYSMEQLRRIGDIFLFVFTSTRHWGVIDGASEGLQLLCERLLHTSSGELRALPNQWVGETLSSVLSGELYVLRRSAGIPALFSSIVTAEASCFSQCQETPLLSRVMLALLDHLRNAHMFTDEELLRENRSREEESIAHALNLLRSMFLNASIASSILKYFESATICCIEAFRSASWLIRNSAMMLFSALVRRGIGVCVERKPHAPLSSFPMARGISSTMDADRRLTGVTALQFFSSHPKLHPFLLKQLEIAVERLTSQTCTDHPALFPTLYLLSSLSPSAAENPSALLSMKPFRTVLRKCLHWRSNNVRHAAAAASVPLIEDPSHVASVVREYLCTGIPKESREMSTVCSTEANTNVSEENLRHQLQMNVGVLKQNHLHGELLAVAAVLKATLRSMGSDDKVDTVRVLASLLPSRVWIARDAHKNPCSVTRASMLTVLAESYEIAREVQDIPGIGQQGLSHARLVIDVCTDIAMCAQNMQEEKRSCEEEVGICEFRTNAAKLLARVVLSSFEKRESPFKDSLQLLSGQILCSHRETIQVGMDSTVRLIDLYCANSRKLEDPPHSCTLAILRRLWEKGRELLVSSEHQELAVEAPRLMGAILKCNAEVTRHSFKFHEQVKNLTPRALAEIAQRHICIDVREHAIILMGQLISATDMESEFVLSWISVVETAASSQQSPTTRIAACTSLDRSRFRRQQHGAQRQLMKEVAVRGLLALAHLLEDGNGDVRACAAEVVHRCMSSSLSDQTFPLDTLPSLMAVSELLAAEYSKSESLFRSMSALLGTTGDCEQDKQDDDLIRELRNDIAVEVGKNGVRPIKKPCDIDNSQRRAATRLFRLEDDALDTEIVLRVQLIAWTYWNIVLGSSSRSSCHGSISDLLTGLLAQLREKVEYSTAKVGQGLVGRGSFSVPGFQDCFKSVVRLLLGVSLLRAAASGLGEAFYRICRGLRESLEEMRVHEDTLHPTLSSAISGIHELLTKETKWEKEYALQRVLFLLPVLNSGLAEKKMSALFVGEPRS